MLPGTNFGTATRLTATGTVCITSANAYIIGVAFQGTGTGSLRLFAGLTATATSGATYLGQLLAYATINGATANQSLYVPFPAYCSGGITTMVPPTADPSLTLFWCPAGGA